MAATRTSSRLAGLVTSAILAVLSVWVPCAYSTIGRGPEQPGAAPVGTINAPEDSVA